MTNEAIYQELNTLSIFTSFNPLTVKRDGNSYLVLPPKEGRYGFAVEGLDPASLDQQGQEEYMEHLYDAPRRIGIGHATREKLEEWFLWCEWTVRIFRQSEERKEALKKASRNRISALPGDHFYQDGRATVLGAGIFAGSRDDGTINLVLGEVPEADKDKLYRYIHRRGAITTFIRQARIEGSLELARLSDIILAELGEKP